MLPLQLAVMSDTVAVALVTGLSTFAGTLFVAFIGFLQWRKGHKLDTTKATHDSEDKFRDDILGELDRVRSRMDTLMNINASLMSEKMSAQILSAQQQAQITELTRRSERADRFEQQVHELTRVNNELVKQIESQGAEIVRLKTRIVELEKGNHHE